MGRPPKRLTTDVERFMPLVDEFLSAAGSDFRYAEKMVHTANIVTNKRETRARKTAERNGDKS